jgi:predicted enzyme related to lactoylglutathione lyase
MNPNTASASACLSLVVYAKDKTRVSAFYQRTLALALNESVASHDLLLGPGLDLVVHAIPAEYAIDIAITKPPQLREDTPFKPVFTVTNLAAVRQAAQATGGGLQDASRAWPWRGCTRLDGHDPEGNVVQFAQPDAA